MENSVTVENEAISLDLIQVRNLPELQGWKEKQQNIVKENPFISIEDYKSYEDAKKHRTALVSARTDIQKQDKLIASKLKELRGEAAKVAEELISITQPHEEKQQEEVKRYEAEREAKRLEEERIEKERKARIADSINDFYNDWKHDIAKAEYHQLEDLKVALPSSIEVESRKDFEEFELDFAEKCSLLTSQLKERIQYLNEQEEARKERERLAAERAAWEKEQAEAKEKAEAEEKERKAREEKERAAREAEEKKIREEREADARELARQRKEIESEKEKIAQETYGIRCERLEKIGFKPNRLGQFVNDQYDIQLEELEDEVYEMVSREFESLLSTADTLLKEAREIQERKVAEEAEAKAKSEAEAIVKKEIEARRLEKLKPDKEKCEAIIKSLSINYSPEVTIKDKEINTLLGDFIERTDLLRNEFQNKLSEIK